jgi:hypothetical protein
VGGVDPGILQVSGMVLQGDITSTATTITLDYTSDMPTSGYIVIEKINSTTGQFENEVIEYTGISGINLTGCTRGTSAQYRGVSPKLTTATSHKSGAKVFGAFKITALNTKTQNNPGMPTTTTIQTGFNFELASVAPASAKGGGFQCTIGPINDRG